MKSYNLLEQSAAKNWLSHSQVPFALQVPWPLQLVVASHATIKDEKRIKTVTLTSTFDVVEWHFQNYSQSNNKNIDLLEQSIP